MSTLIHPHTESAPQPGAVRELAAPLPLTGYWEAAATHEYFDERSGTWQMAVVEVLAGREYVVPPMRVYPEDGAGQPARE